MPPKEDFSLKKIKPKIGVGRVSGSQGLTTSFDLIEEMNYLYVKVFRARGLPQNCDPFVEVKIGNYKATTKYIENQVIWEWNQAFAFKVQQIQDTSIDIKVRDRLIVNGDNAIGGIKFSYPSDAPTRVMPDTPFAPEWYRLQNGNGVRIGAELMLSLWTGTQTDEAFASAWHSDSTTVGGKRISSTRGKVYVAPRLWYLRVNVIQAQDLAPKSKKKDPEVFVKAILGNIFLRTKISPDKNLNPKWGEELMFVAAEPFDEPLILSVEDKSGFDKEECLGKLVIPLQNVDKRSLPIIGVSQKWYNLERHVVDSEEINGKTNFASKLQIGICLEGGYHVFDEPIHLSSDFRPTFKPLWTGVLGVLELGILNARGLTAMKSKDELQTTDAYCVAKYGPKWVKTRTIVDSLNPQWNEQYTWEVYDLFTVITVGVFDNMHLGGKVGAAKDPMIGKLRIRLSSLQYDRIYTYSYPLLVLKPTGLEKMGELQLAIRFTCSSYFNLIWSYITPTLPKMNYSCPISANQNENLRHQAIHVIFLRLGRAEPPIKKEVVECMLYIDSHTWSLRKGRANLARILVFLGAFSKVYKWFQHIRAWDNAATSILAIILYLIVVWFPEVIVYTFFIYCLCFGIWRYWSMPRDPPCIDVKLSLADSVHPDEFEEELDTFPTSIKDEVLRMRYDRLRRIGGRLVAIVGNLATQLERVESLLSWRDPRCTLWCLVFCSCAIILLCLVPIRYILSVLGLHLLKHPKLRFNLSFGPENLLTRLPSKSDSMI